MYLGGTIEVQSVVPRNYCTSVVPLRYRLLRSECHLISISNPNLTSLFSTERNKCKHYVQFLIFYFALVFVF